MFLTGHVPFPGNGNGVSPTQITWTESGITDAVASRRGGGVLVSQTMSCHIFCSPAKKIGILFLKMLCVGDPVDKTVIGEGDALNPRRCTPG